MYIYIHRKRIIININWTLCILQEFIETYRFLFCYTRYPPVSGSFLKCRTIFFCFMSKTNIEIIWIEILQVKGILLVCCIYRPPYSSSAFWQKLCWSFVQARYISNSIVILGNLNIDFLKVNNSHEVHTIMNSCRLTNVIHEPFKKYTQHQLPQRSCYNSWKCVHDSSTYFKSM